MQRDSEDNDLRAYKLVFLHGGERKLRTPDSYSAYHPDAGVLSCRNKYAF